MKFDKFLSEFLYQQKRLSLPNMGEVSLDEKFVLPDNHQAFMFYPQEGISFSYNKKAEITNDLKDYLKKEISKPVSLIASDLEDYFLQIDNLINIGKAYTIEGIGTFSKLSNGTIHFEKGLAKTENISEMVESASNKYTEDSSVIFNKSIKNKAVLKRIGAAFAIIGFLVLAWFVYPFVAKKMKESTSKESQSKTSIVPIVKPTTTIVAQKPDTAKQQLKDTAKSIISTNDTVLYKMYFYITKHRFKADKLFAAWVNHTPVKRDSAIVQDTLRHRLFIFKRAIPKDTAKLKTHFAEYFGHSITITQ